MSDMTVRYKIFIESNIAEATSRDTRLVEDSQSKMAKSVTKTEKTLVGLERTMAKLAGGTSLQRQIGYMERLGTVIQRNTQRLERFKTVFQSGLGKLPSIALGGSAALYAADTITRRPMDYDLQLRYAASTAYGGGSARDIRQGMNELRGMIDGVVRRYGGDRADALRGYSGLVGSGEFTATEAKALLPQIQQASVATNTDGEQLASLSQRLKTGIGVRPEDMGLAFSRLARVGQLGGVELNQMSPLMADLSGNYGALGYRGQRGAVAAAVDLQIANKGAGSAEGARTILDNFYGKIFSVATAKDFKNAQGIDLNAQMADRMAKGMDGVEAFINVAEGVLSKTGDDQKIKKILANADLSDPKKYAEASVAVQSIYERAGIGTFLQDKEALRGMLVLRSNMDKRREMIGSAMGDTGQTMSTLTEVIQASPEIQRQKLLAESAIAVDGAFRTLSPAITGLMEQTTGLAKEYPALASAIAGLTGASIVAAAGLTAVGLTGLLTGGSGAGKVLGKLFPGAAAAGAIGAASKFGPPLPGRMKLERFLGGTASKFAMPGLGFLWDASDVFTNDNLSADGKARGYSRAGTRAAGGWAGATAGAALGTMILPGPGTMVGGLIGSGIGYFGAGGAFDSIWKENKERDYLALTNPSGAAIANAQTGQQTTVQLGEGKLDVQVSVRDDRISTSVNVLQQPSLVRINPGATNPAGF